MAYKFTDLRVYKRGQPPRPPCWQDFIDKSSTSGVSSNTHSLSTDNRKPKDRRHKKACQSVPPESCRDNHNKHSLEVTFSRLKRTRSEPYIADRDIPRGITTETLTQFTLSQQHDSREYEFLDDSNYTKCSRWLAQIDDGSSVEEWCEENSAAAAATASDDSGVEDLLREAKLLGTQLQRRFPSETNEKRYSLNLDNIPE